MNGRKTLFGILVFAFVTRLLLLLYFPLQYTDYYLINTAAQNLVNGHGMGFYRSDNIDLAHFYFEGLRLWPPLVPFLTAIFLKLTGSVTATDIILTTLLLSVLFLYLHKVFTLLNLSTPIQILGYLFVATNTDLLKQPGLSDLAAATFCVGACAYCYNLLTKPTKRKYLTLFFYALLFFLPSAFRYQFYPVTLFFPFAILVSGFLLKDQLLTKQGLLLLLFVLSLILAQEIFLLLYTAQPLTQSVSMDSRGFYLFNLSFIYPFFLKAFVNFSYIENKYSSALKYFSNLYSISMLALFFFWIYKLATFSIINYLTASFASEKRKQLAILILLLLVVIPILVLTLLSISHNSRTGLPGGWTYVKEGRYYIISSLLILILSLWYIQTRVHSFSKAAKKTGTVLLSAILVYNSLLTVKFYYNIATNNIPDKEVTNRTDRAEIERIIDTLSNDGQITVLCSDEPYFSYYAFKPSVAITQKTSVLAYQQIQTSKKTQLLLIPQKPLSTADSLLIVKTNAKQVASLKTTTLYLAVILPSREKIDPASIK